MPEFYSNFPAYAGARYSVFFHAEAAESSKVFDYYKACDDVIRSGLLYLIKRMADIGCIHDETKFRIEDKKNRIYCFKPHQERFFCFFFVQGKIIITSAYTKKKQKLDRHELQRAIKIKNQYL